MMKRMLLLLSLTSPVLASVPVGASSTLEVRFHPAETVYVYEDRGEGTPRDLYSAVLQNLAVVFSPSESEPETLELRRLRLDALRDGEVVASQWIGEAELAKRAQSMHAYQEQGVLAAYDFQFQTSKYLAGVSMAPSTTLRSGQAVVVSRWPMLFVGLPDRIRVVAEAAGANGDPLTAEGSLDVVLHESPNRYRLPVDGRWVAAAGPSLHSHHRWSSIQEFALDLIKIGDDVRTHREGGERLVDYYAYGATVRSMEVGTVVEVLDEVPESDDSLQRSDEGDEEYFARTLQAQQQRLARGLAFAMGNHVVIEHANGEFSHYAHLQPGSISVEVGDRVERGQGIGRLGHSGNSTEPHLHVHVTDGPDIAYSRSLPFALEDTRVFPSDGTIRYVHSGHILESSSAPPPSGDSP